MNVMLMNMYIVQYVRDVISNIICNWYGIRRLVAGALNSRYIVGAKVIFWFC